MHPQQHQLEITIPLPPRATSPNARCHWRTKAKAVKLLREAGFLGAKQAMATLPRPPRWKSASILATLYNAAHQANLLDSDNLIASLKGAIDGIADAGVLDGDRGVTWLPPKQFIRGSASGRHEVVLWITSLDG